MLGWPIVMFSPLGGVVFMGGAAWKGTPAAEAHNWKTALPRARGYAVFQLCASAADVPFLARGGAAASYVEYGYALIST